VPLPGDVDPISPELALVDDRLGDLGREELPDAPDTLSSLEQVQIRRAARSERARRRHRARVAGLLGVATALLVAAAAGLTLKLDDGSDPVPAAAAERSSSAAQEPAGQERSSIELRWRRVRGARFYNVILWRNGIRALDLWPRAPSVRIPEGRLEPGVYQWFVYPSLGEGGAQRYGKVAARGTIKV
jgi:hypothetical protein